MTLLELLKQEAPARGLAIVEAAAPRSADVRPRRRAWSAGSTRSTCRPTTPSSRRSRRSSGVGIDNQLPVYRRRHRFGAARRDRGARLQLLRRRRPDRQDRRPRAGRRGAGRRSRWRASRSPSCTSIRALPRRWASTHPGGGDRARQDRGRVAAARARLAGRRAPMSQIALLGALELGLIYGLVALGVFLSFRVLSFPDLTVDGSFPLGAAVAASAIVGRPRSLSRRRCMAIARGRARGARHRDPQRPLPHPASARQHPDHDRAVLDQPAHHGPAQHRAADRADRADAARAARPLDCRS